MNSVLNGLKNVWRIAGLGLGVLFAPLAFLLKPIAWLLPRSWRSKRAQAWATPTFGVSTQSLDGSLFKPLDAQRAAPQVILRPANPLFVWASLLVALCLNLLPLGSYYWLPDWLALAIMFWSCREPRLVSLGVAFLFGLLMDVHDSTVLGEHSLGYCIIAYGGVLLSRRLPSFGVWSQALQVWPVLLIASVLSLVVRVFFGGLFPGWWFALLSPTFGAAMWALVVWLLLAPQRRPLDIDQNRPL